MRNFFQFSRTDPAPAIPVHAHAPELQEADLAALYYGRRTGCDFYDFIRVSPTRVLFAQLDVAGCLDKDRGIVAAAQKTLRESGASLLAHDEANEPDAMIEVCLRLNQSILTSAGRTYPCPVFAGCYNESLGTVCYFNAGHTPGLVRDASGVSELHATGLPLGLFSHCTPDASIVALTPGAALLLVSRGVVKAKWKDREYGMEQVKHSLQESQKHSAREICVSVVDQIREFVRQPAEPRDVTVMALVRPMSAKALTPTG
jgi:serine phosphatase RsbU (regulator of sigma subunit)